MTTTTTTMRTMTTTTAETVFKVTYCSKNVKGIVAGGANITELRLNRLQQTQQLNAKVT